MKQIALLAIFIALVACSTTKTVVVPSTHDSVAVRTEFIHDSIYIDNWHTIYQKGDTIYRTDSIVHIEYKFVSRGDTLRIHDSIPVIQEVPVVTNEVPKFYRNCTIGFWIIIVLIILYIAWRIVKAVYLRK